MKLKHLQCEEAAYAKRIFVHYMRLAFLSCDLQWDSDNKAEIEAAVDDILEVVDNAIARAVDSAKEEVYIKLGIPE